MFDMQTKPSIKLEGKQSKICAKAVFATSRGLTTTIMPTAAFFILSLMQHYSPLQFSYLHPCGSSSCDFYALLLTGSSCIIQRLTLSCSNVTYGPIIITGRLFMFQYMMNASQSALPPNSPIRLAII